MEIIHYVHCKKCFAQMPKGWSMKDWARLEVGMTAEPGIMVRCVRHDEEVVYLPLMGEPRPQVPQ